MQCRLCAPKVVLYPEHGLVPHGPQRIELTGLFEPHTRLPRLMRHGHIPPIRTGAVAVPMDSPEPGNRTGHREQRADCKRTSVMPRRARCNVAWPSRRMRCLAFYLCDEPRDRMRC